MRLSSRDLIVVAALVALPGCGSCVGDHPEEKAAPVQNTGRLKPLGDRAVQLDPTAKATQIVREAATGDQ